LAICSRLGHLHDISRNNKQPKRDHNSEPAFLGSATLLLAVSRIDVPLSVLPEAINPKSRGNLAVALLSTSTFDARQIDVYTLTLGDGAGHAIPIARRGDGTAFASLEDVDGDGRTDLLAHFDREYLGLSGALAPPNTQLVALAQFADGCGEVSGKAVVHMLVKGAKDR
jgi:hypothetical protein